MAVGPGLQGGTAGVAALIRVQCRDVDGSKRTIGGDVVRCSVTSETGAVAEAHVIDNTDGTHSITYVPFTSGAFCKVVVTVNGTHVQGSPFSAQIAPGRTDPRCTEIFGRGLTDAMSGQVASITMQTKDAFGNRCSEQGDHFDIRITPVKSLVPELEQFLKKLEVPYEVEDMKDGSHVIRSMTAKMWILMRSPALPYLGAGSSGRCALMYPHCSSCPRSPRPA